MKAISIGMAVVGALLLFIGGARLMASGHPPQHDSWFWRALGVELHVNSKALWFYYPDQGGTNDLTFRFWRPTLMYGYLSHETAKLLHDPRMWHGDPAFDPSFRRENEWVYERDQERQWIWPHWRIGFPPINTGVTSIELVGVQAADNPRQSVQ